MRIGKLTNNRSNEYQMQDAMERYLVQLQVSTFKREVRVPEVKRVADFLLIKNGLVNIEAKCNDFKTLIKQLNDHAKYCDYCFALIPDYCMTPKWFKKKLIKKGYGLIVHNFTTKEITEVLEAHHNKPQDKELKSKVIFNIRNERLEDVA